MKSHIINRQRQILNCLKPSLFLAAVFTGACGTASETGSAGSESGETALADPEMRSVGLVVDNAPTQAAFIAVQAYENDTCPANMAQHRGFWNRRLVIHPNSPGALLQTSLPVLDRTGCWGLRAQLFGTDDVPVPGCEAATADGRLFASETPVHLTIFCRGTQVGGDVAIDVRHGSVMIDHEFRAGSEPANANSTQCSDQQIEVCTTLFDSNPEPLEASLSQDGRPPQTATVTDLGDRRWRACAPFELGSPGTRTRLRMHTSNGGEPETTHHLPELLAVDCSDGTTTGGTTGNASTTSTETASDPSGDPDLTTSDSTGLPPDLPDIDLPSTGGPDIDLPTTTGSTETGMDEACNPSDPCCDTGGEFKPQGTECAVEYELRCSNSDPGGKVLRRRSTQRCSGEAGNCSGPWYHEAWYDWSQCSQSEICVHHGAAATCEPRPADCDRPGVACCDPQGFFRPAGYICSEGQQLRCAGPDLGDDIQQRWVRRPCTGQHAACGGIPEYGPWRLREACASHENCVGHGVGPYSCESSCDAETDWLPARPVTETDGVGVQHNQNIQVAVRMEVREDPSSSGLQFRVCKGNGTFSSDIFVSIYDAADGSGARTFDDLNTEGRTCSSWMNMLNDDGYANGEKFGSVWKVISPSRARDSWPGLTGCSFQSPFEGTCWSGTSITLTRTCR